jgi:hypothetical protein
MDNLPSPSAKPNGDDGHETDSAEIDSVEEASRESMDASDPPARSVVTRVGEPKRPSDPVPRDPTAG